MSGAWFLLILAVGFSWAFGLVVVRTGLDWADTFPYSPASEWRYLGVAVLAIVTALLGTIGSVFAFRMHRRARQLRR